MDFRAFLLSWPEISCVCASDRPRFRSLTHFPLLSPENPTLVAAVMPKKRYSQLSYQFACGGG
jgi:hypothetical protein